MNKLNTPAPTELPRDDAIFTLTRLVAVGVIPFLVAAFFILYMGPEATGQWFAWDIASPLTTALMGAGYLGGAYFFSRLLGAERGWHCFAGGFPAVAVFTVVMLAATLLHWDTFDPGHWPFLVWLAIYITTPIIVPLVWWRNRRSDPKTPEPGDVLLSANAGRFMLGAGIVLSLVAALVFFSPTTAISAWPWPLTPLTARVLAGWLALLGTGALTMSRERRWSGWRVPWLSIIIWQSLLAAAFVVRRYAFNDGNPLNWFTLFTVAGLIGAMVFYLRMERRKVTPP